MLSKLTPSQVVQKIDEVALSLADSNGVSFSFADVHVTLTMDERTAHYSLVGSGRNVGGEVVHLHIHIMWNVNPKDGASNVMARSLKVNGKTVDPVQ